MAFALAHKETGGFVVERPETAYSRQIGIEHSYEAPPRARQLLVNPQRGFLTTRENLIAWPGGRALLSFSGNKTTFLEQLRLPATEPTFQELRVGEGRILIVPLPLELNDNLKAIGDVYRYALDGTKVTEPYSTELSDPGMFICATRFEHATLYVLTSESSETDISFRDERSGKKFAGTLQPGRAALLLVSDKGELLASYNW